MLLEGEHKTKFLTFMSATNSRSLVTFQEAIEDVLSSFFEPSVDYEDQLEFLRTGLKKPGPTTPKEFANELELANSYLKLIPGAPENDAGLDVEAIPAAMRWLLRQGEALHAAHVQEIEQGRPAG